MGEISVRITMSDLVDTEGVVVKFDPWRLHMEGYLEGAHGGGQGYTLTSGDDYAQITFHDKDIKRIGFTKDRKFVIYLEWGETS